MVCIVDAQRSAITRDYDTVRSVVEHRVTDSVDMEANLMDNRSNTISAEKKLHYDPKLAAFILAYVGNYPKIARSIAMEYGWKYSKDGELANDWYLNLLQQYFLADQPPSKRSGSKDARIWLKTAMHGLDTTDKLLEKFQREVDLVLLRRNGEV